MNHCISLLAAIPSLLQVTIACSTVQLLPAQLKRSPRHLVRKHPVLHMHHPFRWIGLKKKHRKDLPVYLSFQKKKSEILILRIIQVEATARGHSDQHLLLQAETSPGLDQSEAASRNWMITIWEGQDLVEFRGELFSLFAFKLGWNVLMQRLTLVLPQ